MPSIKPIDATSVHRLHAGQVVLELQGAVKELVENSLDAGATTVEVRFKDSGLDSIEVVDNGSGIPQDDWAMIGKKHHTSKLEDISSLPLVTTFGFRGEALSSLCALCESVTVTTATAETAPMGAVIQLGKDGCVKDNSGRVARPRGTTITLQGLFVPLPVRRKEFERTVKREYTKALSLLYAYALVPASTSLKDGRTGVRLKVEAVGAGRSGKRSTLLTTDGRGSLRSSVTSIWGPKALEGVLDIDLNVEVEIDAVMARREGLAQGSQCVKVTGLISSAAWGQGRTSPDRQFYYINGRPCDLKQVGRLVNEVYRSFNTNQSPLAILDFQIPPESVDINVSPDKRTIFLHSETNLLAALRTALEEFFAPSRTAFPLAGASGTVKIVQSTQQDDEDDRSPDRDASNAPLRPEQRDEESDPDALTEANISAGSLPDGDGEQVDGNAEAGPSRLPFSLKPRTLTPHEAVSEDRSPPTGQYRSSRHELPSGSASTARSLRQPGQAEVDPPPVRRVTQQTLDTTLTSWSPVKRVGGARSSTQPGPRTGKAARIDLRQRLAGFASQGVRAALSDDESLEDVSEVTTERPPTGPPATRGTSPKSDGEEDELRSEGTDIDGHEDHNELDGDDQLEGYEENEQEQSADAHENSDVDMEVETGQPATPDDVAGGADGADVDVEMARDPGEEAAHTSSAPTSLPSGRSRRTTTGIIVADTEPPTPLKAPSSKRTLSTQAIASAHTPRSAPSSSSLRRKSSSYRDEITSTAAGGERTLRFDLDRTRARYQVAAMSVRPDGSLRDAFSALAEGGISAAAGLKNKDAAEAEQALSRVISKADFERMEVLGQFNLGFIIARLRSPGRDGKTASDDLFIIDQHASDEKYNFETLQRTTVIKAQKLIKPRPLQLTAGDEIVAMENMGILKANGFGVMVDEDQAPGRGERIKLSAMPVSKETVFDFKDLEQLLHLLADGARPAGQMVRCSKARTMFASRACRKSVMIGKSLTKTQMTQLLRNMGTIDQPWNCPHGRPTMRHLAKMERPKDDRKRIRWEQWG